MNSLINFYKGKKYTFICNNNWFDKIEYINIEPKFSNDVYSKYLTKINNLEGELIICSNINKLDTFCKKIVNESYQEYLDIIEKRDLTKETWIYNIIDGISEQYKIIYKDEQIIILPNYTWINDDNDFSKMHLLVFPVDKKIHTLRDLNSTHINMLTHIKNKTLQIIKDNYGFDSDIIKIFIHYAPSTYHLHIHFILVSNIDVNSSVEYSHDIDSIINILKLKSDYYQTTYIKKRI